MTPKEERNTNLFRYLLSLIFQVDFILMLLVMWVQAVRNVQMVPLWHMIKHQELKLQIASHVL